MKKILFLFSLLCFAFAGNSQTRIKLAQLERCATGMTCLALTDSLTGKQKYIDIDSLGNYIDLGGAAIDTDTRLSNFTRLNDSTLTVNIIDANGTVTGTEQVDLSFLKNYIVGPTLQKFTTPDGRDSVIITQPDGTIETFVDKSLAEMIAATPDGTSSITDCPNDYIIVYNNGVATKVLKSALHLFTVQGTNTTGSGIAQMTACDTFKIFSTDANISISVSQGSGLIDISTIYNEYTPTVTLSDPTNPVTSLAEISAVSGGYEPGALIIAGDYTVRKNSDGSLTALKQPMTVDGDMDSTNELDTTTISVTPTLLAGDTVAYEVKVFTNGVETSSASIPLPVDKTLTCAEVLACMPSNSSVSVAGSDLTFTDILGNPTTHDLPTGDTVSIVTGTTAQGLDSIALTINGQEYIFKDTNTEYDLIDNPNGTFSLVDGNGAVIQTITKDTSKVDQVVFAGNEIAKVRDISIYETVTTNTIIDSILTIGAEDGTSIQVNLKDIIRQYLGTCIVHHEEANIFDGVTGGTLDISALPNINGLNAQVKVFWNGQLLNESDGLVTRDYVLTAGNVIQFEEDKDDCRITVIVQYCTGLD